MNRSTNHLTLAADAAIDLHLHTTYSDGDWTPAGLIDHLLQAGFGLAAITDHDRADTAAAIQQLALDKGLPVLAAAEMSTLWPDEMAGRDEMSGLPNMTDLLCFGFDPEGSPLHDLSREVFRRAQENTRSVFENIRRQGYALPDAPEGFEQLLATPSAQQPHALVAFLKSQGLGQSGPSAGRIALEAGLTFTLTDLSTVVDTAHRSGAVCLLAHPGHQEGGFVTYTLPMLDKLRQEIPIDGLEVYHTKHTPAQAEMYLEYAQRHHLLISAGSDSHRPKKPPIQHRAETCRALLERLGVQVQ